MLIGDAAAKPDPDWGCGLSLTLMDVRTLRDELRLATDWHKAAHQYADRAAQYFADLHAVEQWFTDLTWDQGVEADARRTDILAKLDQPGAPDIIGLGPTSPKDMPAG